MRHGQCHAGWQELWRFRRRERLRTADRHGQVNHEDGQEETYFTGRCAGLLELRGSSVFVNEDGELDNRQCYALLRTLNVGATVPFLRFRVYEPDQHWHSHLRMV